MARILALDYGEKRIGIAISDPSGTIASIPDKALDNNQKIVSELKQLIKEFEIEKILIGNPKNLKGEREFAGLKVKNFVELLNDKIRLPMELLDERFTTRQAGGILSGQGVKTRSRRALIDNTSAQILLQAYLDSKNKGN